MIQPKVLGIIGGRSKMARLIQELFGCEVVYSDIRDPNGLSNEELAQRADIIFVSVLPISKVGNVIREITPHVRPGTLLLHGTSVQNPVYDPIRPALLDHYFLRNSVTTGFCHLKFGPSVGSLRGQTVIFGLLNEADVEWREFLLGLFGQHRMRVVHCTPEEHDLRTTGSQLTPMVSSLLTAHVWHTGSFDVSSMLDVAGPPAVLQALGVMRNLSQPEVLAEILVNHPKTSWLLKRMREGLDTLETAVRRKDAASIRKLAKRGISRLSDEKRAGIVFATDWHIRTEGDLRGGAICFRFSSEENRLGLLSRVLSVFDHYGLEKTSCASQELPDGGCMFFLGLKDIESMDIPSVCAEVTALCGGEVVTAAR